MAGIIGIASVEEQYAIGLVKQEHASAEARRRSGHPICVPRCVDGCWSARVGLFPLTAEYQSFPNFAGDEDQGAV